MIRAALITILMVPTVPAAAMTPGERLTAANACLEKRLVGADTSAVSPTRLVATAMKDCRVVVAAYLKSLEDRTYTPPITYRAPRRRRAQTPRQRRETARRELVETLVDDIVEKRTARRKP